MKGRAAAWAALWLVCVARTSLGATWPFPLVETEHVVADWLEQAGFEVRRHSSAPGTLRLDAAKEGVRRTLLLRAHSPLSTDVSAADDDPKPAECEKALADLLARRLRGTQALPDHQVPPAVLARREAVVCVEAETRGEKLQFSGFVVDRSGTLVTTAHGVDGGSSLVIRRPDERSVPARVVRTDPRRDLALASSPAAARNPVELSDARLTLDEGERVYAIGCPDGGEKTVRAGVAHTAMRRVEGLVLWEVEMETRPGGSGSPLFDASGRLAGVVKGRFRGDDTRALVIPSETVVRFWKSRP